MEEAVKVRLVRVKKLIRSCKHSFTTCRNCLLDLSTLEKATKIIITLIIKENSQVADSEIDRVFVDTERIALGAQ